MAPLTGDLVGALKDALPGRDPTADAGPEDHAEHRLVAAARTVDRLGEREAVGVVGDPDRAGEPGLEVGPEWPADEPGGVRVLDQAGGVGDHAGDADANRTGLARFGLELGDQSGDGVETGTVVAQGWNPAAGGDDGVGGEGDGFGLGPTQINADPHRLPHTASRQRAGPRPDDRPGSSVPRPRDARSR